MKIETTPVPHSWAIEDWPEDVYPNAATRGRYLVRTHRGELMKAGALARIGRELIVLGAPYAKWLARQVENVEGYEIAPNKTDEPA